jgi:hypothetical protein
MAERRGIARFAGAFAALLMVGVVAGCGSSAGSDSGNAQQLLTQTFSGSHTVKSGVLTFRVTLTPSGSSSLSGPITLSLTGPFETRGSGKPPESDFTIGLDALGRRGQLGLVSTGSSGYVTLDGAAYQLPASDFHKLASSFSSAGTGGAGGGLAKLGIEPLHWVTSPAIVGNENIGGTSTTHIHATVNVAALLNDLNTFLHKASSTGASSKIPASISAAARSKIASEVRHPTVDIWTGTSDHTLRRLSLNLGFPVTGQVSAQLGGMSSAGFGMTLQYAHLNEPQTISAPSNVKPFSQFESKLQGVLGEVQGATGGTIGSSSSGSGSSSGTAGTVNKYTKCIQNAGSDVSKMQKCAGLLNGSGG